MPLTTTDRHFLALAEQVRATTDDPLSSVGTVIASPAGEMIASSANTVPERMRSMIRSLRNRFLDEPASRYHLIEHAERAAIYKAALHGHSVSGATIYNTRFPCADCARAISEFGIARIVTAAPSPSQNDDKWREHFDYALEIFHASDVEVVFAP